MDDDQFGNFSLPDESMRVSDGTIDDGSARPEGIGSANPELQRMMEEDPDVAGLFSTDRNAPYDRDANVRSRRVTYSREVLITPKAKGGKVAKWGFVFGISAALMGLVFMGGFLLDYYLGTSGMFITASCWLGLLGAAFSFIGILLSSIGLALGAGLNKGKAIFGIIFSIFYWVMMGMYLLLAMFVIAAMASTTEIIIW